MLSTILISTSPISPYLPLSREYLYVIGVPLSEYLIGEDFPLNFWKSFKVINPSISWTSCGNPILATPTEEPKGLNPGSFSWTYCKLCLNAPVYSCGIFTSPTYPFEKEIPFPLYTVSNPGKKIVPVALLDVPNIGTEKCALLLLELIWYSIPSGFIGVGATLRTSVISGKEYDGISPPSCNLNIFLLIFIIFFCIRCNISIICTIS